MEIWTKVKNYPKIGLVVLAYIAYIGMGMPDGLLGIAWPSIRSDFSIPLDAAGMLLTAFVIGYLTSGLLSGLLIARYGVGTVVATSCTVTGAGLIGYTIVPEWWMIVMLGVFAGLGAGAIDAGLNNFVAAHFNEKLMQWLHASYGIGITLGPVIMTFALTTFNSWRAGYQIVGAFQLALVICFTLTLPMWNKRESDSDEPKQHTDYKTPLVKTLRQPRVWLSLFIFFLYVGSEVALGTWAYTLLIESRGIQPETAAFWAGSYWASFTVGRILAGFYVKKVGNNLLVTISLIFSVLGSALLGWNLNNITSLVSVALIGFAIAPIFPALMSETSRRVGVRFTVNTIGMQTASGVIGFAVIPGLVGVLARHISLEVVPICLMVLFILLLSFHLLAIRFRAEI